MRRNDVILQTITRVVSFIILALALYIFFAGHNDPGGGFIGGLMTAAGLVLLYLAYDIKLMGKVLPVNFIQLTAVGLFIAVLTGMGSFIFGAPFLSHTYDYFSIPLLGNGEDTELATAVLFDIGVYLTVIGVTMTIITTIGEDTN